MLNWSTPIPTGHPLKRKFPAAYPDQVLPEATVPGITKVLYEFHDTIADLQRRFLRIIAEGIGCHETFFDEMVDNGPTLTRAIRYPPMTEVPAGEAPTCGPAEHGDINLITALPRATAPGLQVRSTASGSMPSPPTGQVIINTGIMLERLTNGRIPIGWHRVVAAPGFGGERYSVVQFCHPRPWTMLSPVPSCCTPETPQRFHALSAADALDEVLYQINLVEDARRVSAVRCSRTRRARPPVRRHRDAFLDDPTAQLEPPKPFAPAILAIDIGGSKIGRRAGVDEGRADRPRVDAGRARRRTGGALFATLDDDRRAADGRWPTATSSASPARRHRRAPGRSRRNCETVSPINIPAWREFPLRERRARADRQARCTATSTPRRWRSPRAGWARPRGTSNYCVITVSTGVGGGHRARRRAARRRVGQRRPHRPHHRRAQRAALRVRRPRLPRGRGVGHGDRGDHRPLADRADLRDHAAHRPPRRPGRGLAVQPARPRPGRRSAAGWRSASGRRSSTPPRRS